MKDLTAYLGAVGVRSSVRHGEETGLGVTKVEVLVCVGGINTFAEGRDVGDTDQQTCRHR